MKYIFIICLSFFSFAVFCQPFPVPEDKEVSFDVIRKKKIIGNLKTKFLEDNDKLILHSILDINVKVLFIPAYKFQTEKFFDLVGSLTYLIITNYVFIHSCISNEMNLGNLFLCLLIVIWAVRLGYFLFSRVLKNGEDKRFKLIKVSPTKFFMTWTLQGMWVSMCLLCVLTALSSYSGIIVNNIFYIGLMIFISGFIIEVLADHQKTVFRRNTGFSR